MSKLACIAIILSLTASVAGAAPPTAQIPTGGFQTGSAAPDQYLLGPFDKITVKVFEDEKLGADKIEVDGAGKIVLPMIGQIQAGGKSPSDLAGDIQTALGKYLQSPHVTVLMNESVSQRVTVNGAVTEAGIYPLKGHTTLLEAIALAKGPDMKAANLRHVAVFRTIDGKNARALFDLKAIQAGTAQDPEIYGGDSIVVEGSTGKEFWHELVQALPALAVFAYF